MKIPLILCLTLTLGLPAFADEPKKSTDEEKWLEQYAQLATPGVEHKRLEALTGDWTVTTRWQLAPGKEAKLLTGTATTRPILGGRFFESTTHSNGPMAVESLTIFGFDRRTSEYTFVSFDTLGTYYVTAAGKWSDGEKAIVMSGAEDDPVMKLKQTYKIRIKPAGDDRFVLTVSFDLPGGREFTAAESTYERKRS